MTIAQNLKIDYPKYNLELKNEALHKCTYYNYNEPLDVHTFVFIDRSTLMINVEDGASHIFAN